MPMEISPAPEVFQRLLNQALEGLQGIHIIADDVLITGEGETVEMAYKDHDRKLRLFLDRCRCRHQVVRRQIQTPSKRIVIHWTSTYIGRIKSRSRESMAINEMPRLTDVKGVQRLLGMVNYLSKCCRHLSFHCELLRQLTY